MAETFTKEQYMGFLSLAPTNVLEHVGNGLIATLQNLPEDSLDAEMVGVMLMMLAEEHELRQIEPLWRKAKRFAIRNSEKFAQVGKVAACIGAGILLGVSIDD
jgi:hypothetical protein